MPITYHPSTVPDLDQLIALYDRAGLPRPLSDRARMSALRSHANLWITAWDGDQLVGVARSLTDAGWCCYLADLAVCPTYQHHGIGRELVAQTKKLAGPQCIVLLLAVPSAMSYYPKIGMEAVSNGFILNRTE